MREGMNERMKDRTTKHITTLILSSRVKSENTIIPLSDASQNATTHKKLIKIPRCYLFYLPLSSGSTIDDSSSSVLSIHLQVSLTILFKMAIFHNTTDVDTFGNQKFSATVFQKSSYLIQDSNYQD